MNPISRAPLINDPSSAGINLTDAGSFQWNVAIPNSQLAVTQQYLLRFIIEPNNFNGFPSPGFLIQGGSTTSSSSISSTAASYPTPSSTITLTGSKTGAPAAASGRLSTSAKVAIGVVIPVRRLPHELP